MNKVCKIFIIIIAILMTITLVGLFMSLAKNGWLIELYEDFSNGIIIDPDKFYKKLNKLILLTLGIEAIALVIFIVIGILTKPKKEEIQLVENTYQQRYLKEEDIMSRKERAEKREAKKAEKQEKKVEVKVEDKKTEIKVAPAQTVEIKVESNNSPDDFLNSLRNRRR